MKWIPKYQKAGKLDFKTTGLPWQQSKQDQEITRNAQSTGTLNPTNLKRRLQPAAKNLKAKYNNLSVRERAALAKQSMPHSEVVTVKDQQGNTKTSINPQAGAMSGADPVGEFVVGTAAGNLGLGLGKMALSKMGQNAVSHWARNSLLNETAGNLTKNIATPLMESEAVPLEDGFVYRTFTPSHGGWVRDGRVYNRIYGLGDVKVQNGKYYSVRQAHFNNPDKLWWDKFGHNRGQVVQVTKESNTQSLQDAANNGFSLNWGSFGKGYRLSDPIKTNEVINYKLDPITNTMVPSMPGKIINNKQTPSEILSTSAEDNPIMQLSYYKPTRKAWNTGKAEGNEATSYFFKQQPNQRFELVKDVEPNNYSVHFKTDRDGLSYDNKMQLFAKVADEVPEGANLSTWGSISKGGIHGINRFGKDFEFIQNGTRQLTMKGSGEPVNVGVFQKPSYSFLTKANQFANTYGYPKLYMDKSDNLESQVKAMLEQHNTFARGVHTPDIEEQKQIKSIIGQNATIDDMLQYVSTHGRLEDPRKRIFISGSSNAQAYSGFPNNGRTALVQRKYKLGPDRNKWFDEADFKIYPQSESDNINTPHIRAPWAQGKSDVPETELSSENGELLFKEWAQPEIRTVKDTEGNRHWWLQEQFPENKLSKNLKVR